MKNLKKEFSNLDSTESPKIFLPRNYSLNLFESFASFLLNSYVRVLAKQIFVSETNSNALDEIVSKDPNTFSLIPAGFHFLSLDKRQSCVLQLFLYLDWYFDEKKPM